MPEAKGIFKLKAPRGKILTVGEVMDALATMPRETELRAEITPTGKLKAIIVSTGLVRRNEHY